MNKFYLFPGMIFADRKPHVVDTVLGSCVAVVLWDPVLRFGGINHFMLPRLNGNGVGSYKYGDMAFQGLLNTMLKAGSKKLDLKAKVFGGSISAGARGIFQIGQRNLEFAFEGLKTEGIPIISHSVGGKRSRKIVFYSETGDVLVKYLKPANNHIAAPLRSNRNHG